MDLGTFRREPKAELRQAAAAIHEMFVALLDAGFTEHQALVVVGQLLATQQPPQD